MFNWNKAPKAATAAAVAAGIAAAGASAESNAAPGAQEGLDLANIKQESQAGNAQSMRLAGAQYDKASNTITLDAKKPVGAPIEKVQTPSINPVDGKVQPPSFGVK